MELHSIKFHSMELHSIKLHSMELHSKKLHSMELHSSNFCFFVCTKFNARNIIFNQRPVVINKISSNSGKNCKNYYHQ